MHTETLQQTLLLLTAAVLIVAVFRRLNLSPVLGYLAAGAAIGPYGLAIIEEVKGTAYLAEFGVVFLLFYIGLELTLDRLKAMKKHVFGFGSLQVLITGVTIGLICIYFGLKIEAAIIIGGSLALSSTAIVLQVLAERGEEATQVGRLALAVLILQDLAVVPLLVMVPLFAAENADIGNAIMGAFLRASLTLIAIFIFGRLFLKPLFRAIGNLKSQELFIATTLLIVLGAAYATEHFGLTLALGAFVAGLMVAETEFRHQVESIIIPFKSLLLGLFFMTVGMSIDTELLFTQLNYILLISVGLILLKAFIILGLALLFKFRIGRAIHSGLLLSQGGEFAFVIFGIAIVAGVIPKDTGQILLVVVTVTMAVTPLLASIGDKISDSFDKRRPLDVKDAVQENIDMENHVIISGFGRMGKTIGKLLSAEKINYVALDTDPKSVYNGHLNGFPVYYGDASNMEVLKSVGIDRANVVIITAKNSKDNHLKSVENIREMYPALPIIVRVKDVDYIKKLEDAGASLVIPETFETSLRLGGAALGFIGVPEHEINRIVEVFRSRDYAIGKEISEQEKKDVDFESHKGAAI